MILVMVKRNRQPELYKVIVDGPTYWGSVASCILLIRKADEKVFIFLIYFFSYSF